MLPVNTVGAEPPLPVPHAPRKDVREQFLGWESWHPLAQVAGRCLLSSGAVSLRYLLLGCALAVLINHGKGGQMPPCVHIPIELRRPRNIFMRISHSLGSNHLYGILRSQTVNS